MAFRVPTFNLVVNVWSAPALVSAAPTRVLMGNLTNGRRLTFGGEELASANYCVLAMFLLLPKLSRIRGSYITDYGDAVEVPAGSGRFYIVAGVDDVAKGFPNEYRIASLYQGVSYALSSTGNPWAIPPWPDPIP